MSRYKVEKDGPGIWRLRDTEAASEAARVPLYSNVFERLERLAKLMNDQGTAGQRSCIEFYPGRQVTRNGQPFTELPQFEPARETVYEGEPSLQRRALENMYEWRYEVPPSFIPADKIQVLG